MVGKSPASALKALLLKRRSVRSYTGNPIELRAIRSILSAAQEVTAADGRRTTPSAHALHPLKLFLIARRVNGLEPAIYEYRPEDGSLHRINEQPGCGVLLSASLSNDSWLEDAAAIVIVGAQLNKAIGHFFDQQADGKRGARYVDFEAGACTQNMYLTVAAEDLGAVVVMGFDDERLKEALSLSNDVTPVALFCIGQPHA